MPRHYYQFLLKVRPHENHGSGRPRSAQAVRTVTVVARSKFDAEWAFRSTNPRMTVLRCERGKAVDPPAAD